MKCQILFSRKNTKNVISLSSAEFSPLHGKCIPKFDYQGPVVQSVISLSSSLRVISLTVLANSIYNILIFFAEKM